MRFTLKSPNPCFPEFESVPPAFPTLESLRNHMPRQTDPEKVARYGKLVDSKINSKEPPSPFRVRDANAAEFAEALCKVLERAREVECDHFFSVTVNDLIGLAWVSNAVKSEFSLRILDRSSEIDDSRWQFVRTLVSGMQSIPASRNKAGDILEGGAILQLCRLIKVDNVWTQSDREKSEYIAEHIRALGHHTLLGQRAKRFALGDLATEFISLEHQASPLASRLKLVAACFREGADFVGKSLVETTYSMISQANTIESPQEAINLASSVVILLNAGEELQALEELMLYATEITVDRFSSSNAKKIAAAILVGIACEEPRATSLATEAIVDLKFFDDIEDQYIIECLTQICEPNTTALESVYEHGGFSYLLSCAARGLTDPRRALVPIAIACSNKRSYELLLEIYSFNIEQRVLDCQDGLNAANCLIEAMHRANAGSILAFVVHELMLSSTLNVQLLTEAIESIRMLTSRGYTFQKLQLDEIQSLIDRRIQTATGVELSLLRDLYIYTTPMFVTAGEGSRSRVFDHLFSE